MDIKIRIDNQGFTYKPNKYEISKISDRLSNVKTKRIAFDEFCKLVGSEGHSFCVSEFNGSRKTENFAYQQIFALDFDNTDVKGSYSQISELAESYNLPIALAYETFSSTNEGKFRIVFINDSPVEDIKVAEFVMDVLMCIFKGCDIKCKDVARLFFGGKKILTKSEAYMSIESLLMEFPRFLKDKYGENHYKKQLEKFAIEHGVELCGGFIDINKKRSEKPAQFKSGKKKFYINFTEDEPVNRKGKKEVVRGFNFDKFTTKCRLYHDFVNDLRWLYHNELFGIACNFKNIYGGKKQFMSIIQKSKNDTYRQKDWNYYFNYMVASEYKPESCDNFCPYAETCTHAENMILTGKTLRNTVVKLKEKEYCSLEEAEADFESKFLCVVNDYNNEINIVKAQTAIGKTHSYVNVIKNSNKKFIVAVPTNILKDEVYDRLKAVGVDDVVKTASIKTLEDRDDEIGDNIKEFLQYGAYTDMTNYLKKEAKDGKEYLLDYIKPLETYGTDDVRVIVTTHKKFLSASEEFLRNYEVIIDEDILLSAVKNSVAVSKKDLMKLKNYKKVQRYMSNLEGTDGEYFLTESIDEYVHYDIIKKKNITTNVNGFMRATAIKVDKDSVHCFVPPTFKNVKHIILSATADEDVYGLFFRDRTVNCVNCKEAKNKGKLIQDCSRSFSRRDIDSDDTLFDTIIKENSDAEYIITFMKYKEKTNDCRIHYGNTEGCDYMKGKNIAVVGTPHYNEVVYKLFGTYLGVDVSGEMSFREIDDGYYRYWLHSYESFALQKIQLWIIKSELIQAVGRARILREDCTVKLCASIPLPQAIIV